MLCTRISRRAAVAAGAALGVLMLSMAACGTATDSPTRPSPIVQLPTTSARDALIAQYNAAGGPNWTNATNWLSREPLGTWYGVEAENDRVIKLDLCGPDGNNLHGTIAPELGSLTNATDLRLSNNFLTGTIPSTLGNMASLKILRLSNNALSGAVPSELGSLTNLVELRLHQNQLIGELPQSLMNLTGLRRLRIEDNAGLCAPADDDFQEWLATLDEFVSDCGTPTQAHAGSMYRPALVTDTAHEPLGFFAVRSRADEAGRWLDVVATGPIIAQSPGATICTV